MQVYIFILCYNEQVLLPHTIKHYKKYIPNCNITIYDNESTDNSVEIAKKLGCEVISWSSNNKINDDKYKNIKNNCWKHLKNGWVIVCDMDEFLCVKEEDLINEQKQKKTILQVKGMNMVGESKKLDVSDIDNLHTITKSYYNNWISKNCCFLREHISEMNYNLGAHKCRPEGTIFYSKRLYINKHFDCLGLKSFVNRRVIRWNRSKMNKTIPFHYIENVEEIKKEFYKNLKKSRDIKILVPWAFKYPFITY